MASFNKLATVIANYLVVFLLITITYVSGISQAEELRPSVHGLAYQGSPPSGQKLSPNMTSFFGGKGSASTSSNVALPAGNSSNSTSWWRGTIAGGDSWTRDSNDGGRNHVRKVLLVTSLVCGITGVVILVVSSLLYIFKFRKHRSSIPQSSSSLSFDKSKLQLVVYD